MKRAFLVAITAALALQPVSASAQIFNGTPFDVEYLKFISGSGVGGAYGVQVGPYWGKFKGNTSNAVINAGVADQVLRSTTTLPFALYCVDFQHYASNSNGLVTATALAGDLSGTNTRLQDFGTYQRAAYLSSLFDSWEHLRDTESELAGLSQENIWGGLHAAIWDATTGPTGGETLGAGAQAAFDFFDDLADQNAGGYDTSGWYILSELNSLTDQNSGQEFLMRVSVPEPSTLLLLTTGVFLLIGVRRRRMVELAG